MELPKTGLLLGILNNCVWIDIITLLHKIRHIVPVANVLAILCWGHLFDIINFSRNFGKAGLCAGLENAAGDACLILDADLQHPPEVIPEMVRLWSDEGYDVVEGVKTDRGLETIFGKATALTFYKLFNKASGINLDSASDFKLLDKKVIEAWKTMRESITFFRGMSAWLGYRLPN